MDKCKHGKSTKLSFYNSHFQANVIAPLSRQENVKGGILVEKRIY
jgi:hypothetical protein